MKLVEAIQNITGCTLGSLRIWREGRELLDFRTDVTATNNERMEDGDLLIEMNYNREAPLDERDRVVLRELAELYVEGRPRGDASELETSFALLDIIVQQKKNIDEITASILRSLVQPGGFDRVGVLFLNEALMELRGVIYAEQGAPVNMHRIKFKTVRVPVKKGPLSDVMFFDRQSIVDLTDTGSRGGLAGYFVDSVLVSPLDSSNGPVGVMFAKKDEYSDVEKSRLDVYARICSLALEVTRTRKRLDFAVQDINYFKQSLYAADTLVKIGKLATTVAHELRNPLVAIGGFARRLEVLLEGNSQGLSYVRTVLSEVDRLENIVADILAYARKMELSLEEVFLAEAVNDVLRLFEEKLTYSLVTTEVHIAPKLTARLDKNRFRQVLVNLVSNAMQAMENGGKVTFEAEAGTKHVILSIRDEGGGIPDELLDRIFEPFFTTKEDGTGLGLAMTKKIMLSHGGDVTVSNTERGANFSVFLPKPGGGNGNDKNTGR